MTIHNAGQNISLMQGDTGNVEFRGIPTDKTYTAYLSIYDEENNKILKEISTLVNNGVAIFSFSKSFSDSLPVGEWVYGLKICSGTGVSTMEDTLLPRKYVENNELIQEPAPLFTVFYKYVEGVE